MKRPLPILIFAVLVAAIGWGGWILLRSDDGQPAVQTLKPLKDKDPLAELKLAQLKAMRQNTNPKDLIDSTPVVVPVPLPPPPPPPGQGYTAGMPPSGSLIQQQGMFMVDQMYGRSVAQMNLSPKDNESFKKLLLDRSTARLALQAKSMTPGLTPEQSAKMTSDYEAAMKTSDAAIQGLLSPENYQRFDQWETVEPMRAQFELVGGPNAFATSGEPLTPDQEDKLVNVMASVRKASGTLPDVSNPMQLLPGSMTDEKLNQFNQDAQTILQQASSFLSPTQLQALGTVQDGIRNVATMTMKMASLPQAPAN
jgi:hypothetical protein